MSDMTKILFTFPLTLPFTFIPPNHQTAVTVIRTTTMTIATQVVQAAPSATQGLSTVTTTVVSPAATLVATTSLSDSSTMPLAGPTQPVSNHITTYTTAILTSGSTMSVTRTVTWTAGPVPSLDLSNPIATSDSSGSHSTSKGLVVGVALLSTLTVALAIVVIVMGYLHRKRKRSRTPLLDWSRPVTENSVPPEPNESNEVGGATWNPYNHDEKRDFDEAYRGYIGHGSALPPDDDGDNRSATSSSAEDPDPHETGNGQSKRPLHPSLRRSSVPSKRHTGGKSLRANDSQISLEYV